MTSAAAAAIAEGRGPIVVMMLRLRGGTSYAIGTESAEITQRGIDTSPIQVSPGLQVDGLDVEVDPFALAGETALTQAQVSFTLPDSLIEAAGDYRQIGAASAELARVWPGEAWQDRVSLLVGTRLAGVTLGLAGEPSTLTLEAARAATSAMIGDATRTIGADFPAPLDTSGNDLSSLDGVQYPAVHGTPYTSQGFKVGEVGADGYDRVVIAGHHFADTGTVEAFSDGASLGTFTVYNSTVGTQKYAYIRSNTVSVFDSSSGAITVKPARGGIAGINGTSAAKSLGDLAEYWLSISGLTVDWARSRKALAYLQSWPGGVYLDAATPAIEAVRDYVIAVAPIIELQSSDGLWLYVADMDIAPYRGTLTAGQELVGRVGGVKLSELEQVRNTVTVRYALDEYTGEFTGAETVNEDGESSAYVSTQLYGVLAHETVEAPMAGDAGTARRIGRGIIRRRATQRRTVSYVVADWVDLSVGEVYTIADSSLSIERRAVVVAIAGVVARVASFTVLDSAMAG